MDPLAYLSGDADSDQSHEDADELDQDEPSSKRAKKSSLTVEDLRAHGYKGESDLQILSENPDPLPETREERHAREKKEIEAEVDAERAIVHKEQTGRLMKQHWALQSLLHKLQNPEPKREGIKTKRTLVKAEGQQSEYFVEEPIPPKPKLKQGIPKAGFT